MRFSPLRSPRLLLRPVRSDDAGPLYERRNDPGVAEWQSWSLPFERDRADEAIAGSAALAGPTDGQWWMATIADPDDTEVFGDLAVHLSWSGRSAEVGYTLARSAWGNGYASEALATVLAWLWSEPSLTRVHATTHPDNTASAMVLERNGFLFEGHTRRSYWVGDVNSDDWLYGMTRADWSAWNTRRRATPKEVQLVELSTDNIAVVRGLTTHHWQQRFVAPIDDSLASALVPPQFGAAPAVPWLRAVIADGEVVGFVMLAATSDAHPEPSLWRLMIDRRHQRRGIGKQVIALAIGQCRAMGAPSMLVYWQEGRGSPRPLYLRHGFVPTGRVHEGETEARLRFD